MLAWIRRGLSLSTPKRNYQVYGLYCTCGCESEDPTVRYVGQASRGARDRFNKHVYSARNDATWPVSRWMRKHGVENINYVVLETVGTARELDLAETTWIAQLGTLIQDAGYNIRPGGNGASGYKHSVTAKTHIPRDVSEETRSKISSALKGRFSGSKASNLKTTREQAEEVIQRYWSGETIREIHESMGIRFSTVSGIASGQSWIYLPRPDSPRTVKATGRFETGTTPPNTKLTEEDVRSIRQRHALGESQASISRDYGVTKENVGMIVNRKTWKHVD